MPGRSHARPTSVETAAPTPRWRGKQAGTARKNRRLRPTGLPGLPFRRVGDEGRYPGKPDPALQAKGKWAPRSPGARGLVRRQKPPLPREGRPKPELAKPLLGATRTARRDASAPPRRSERPRAEADAPFGARESKPTDRPRSSGWRQPDEPRGKSAAGHEGESASPRRAAGAFQTSASGRSTAQPTTTRRDPRVLADRGASSATALGRSASRLIGRNRDQDPPGLRLRVR